ncbi:hypothetical protein [Cellulosimicrobium protaetiae]|uniref:Uncharacterized protein n=1 Tax=Cellulosimicrobium protaetiae TaxID=2587808 RepID=A0A6M5UM58_9MICO|nr:hypothetical protein [Cellulosimicrobium protaetiae]QJW37939.1 hypothetical protein FIC82_018950 [Cellulosimicrobium protaetiae]
MSNSAPTGVSVSSPQRLPLPGVATALFVLAPLLAVPGALTFLGSSSSTYDATRLSAVVGIALFWVGVAALMSALVLAGVRSIAQRQLDVLLQARRDG